MKKIKYNTELRLADFLIAIALCETRENSKGIFLAKKTAAQFSLESHGIFHHTKKQSIFYEARGFKPA